MITKERLQELARQFLDKADKLNELVSAYLDGSNEKNAVRAYCTVREYDKRFIDALNEYWNEHWQYGLNYELAEWTLGNLEF